MQFEFLFRPVRARPAETPLLVGGRPVRLALVRHRRARRYVLRLRPDGSARVTIPRGGSESEGRAFAEKHAAWIEQQLLRLAARPARPRSWEAGSEILYRGQLTRLEPEGDAGVIRLGDQCVRVPDLSGDLRPAIERHLRALAARELPPRVVELAAQHQLPVRRVTIRNQRSRWGSCSRRGTISLNWRLVQAPPRVRDYIILHELMHLREMNHSPRFWSEVGRVCPAYPEAERWLKQHSALLR